MFVSVIGEGGGESIYLYTYKFLFEVFQFLNVGNTFLKKKNTHTKKNLAGAKSNMASVVTLLCLQSPACSPLHSASSTRKARGRLRLRGPQSGPSPRAIFGVNAWGQCHPGIQTIRAPSGPTPPRAMLWLISSCPLPTKRKVSWPRGRAYPELTAPLLEQPLGSPESPAPQALSPPSGPAYQFPIAVKKWARLRGGRQPSCWSHGRSRCAGWLGPGSGALPGLRTARRRAAGRSHLAASPTRLQPVCPAAEASAGAATQCPCTQPLRGPVCPSQGVTGPQNERPVRAKRKEAEWP